MGWLPHTASFCVVLVAQPQHRHNTDTTQTQQAEVPSWDLIRDALDEYNEYSEYSEYSKDSEDSERLVQ
jgi:hypothetical protein